jgi:hypothetical protein
MAKAERLRTARFQRRAVVVAGARMDQLGQRRKTRVAAEQLSFAGV